MLNVVVFGQGMLLPLVVSVDTTLDMTDVITIAMVQRVIIEAIAAVEVGRKEYSEGKGVEYRVQVFSPLKRDTEVNPNDN